MFKKLLTHSAIYGISPQLIKVANIFALPIITKDLTSTDFGIFECYYSLYGCHISFFNFGIKGDSSK